MIELVDHRPLDNLKWSNVKICCKDDYMEVKKSKYFIILPKRTNVPAKEIREFTIHDVARKDASGTLGSKRGQCVFVRSSNA